ncbi:glycosyltransferase [Pseudomonas izuensis]|uniref:Glycosytransferase n=1 Tax=Pseudomonas izuensis TaxID=2684212 RepID=A0ABM7RNP2_9PSED|nr:glycosyltransferase [Pseudomonas izuensis]BCX66889.1 glycosytransferase [Pseudomonas izuensis]
MLKSLGVKGVFTPKNYPQLPSFRSASVTYSEDQALDIPEAELKILNDQDWYGAPTVEAWGIANKYFDVAFFIVNKPEIVRNISSNFNGAILWRAYGQVQGLTHGDILNLISPDDGVYKLKGLGERFWFAQAYQNLSAKEPQWMAKRSLYLPLGMADSSILDGWVGGDKRIFFICPDIETNSYYSGVFNEFEKNFKGLPYAVGGAQSIRSSSKDVLGYVTDEEHQRNMREMRVMFYHSTELTHVHYHPFEAVRAGMPLVFMAGGMLDSLGGKELPGRCLTIKDARDKIKRILNDDWKLINSIRDAQSVLLEAMKAENCEPSWRLGFERVLTELAITKKEQALRPVKRKRIAIIVPVGYRGGSLRGTKLLAEALLEGSKQWGEPAEIVLLHLDNDEVYSPEEFSDLHKDVKVRSFNWKVLDQDAARRAMHYSGREGWEPVSGSYVVPDDGIKQLMDCDAWVVISDRLTAPLLPLRPILLMVYDYLQRYVPLLSNGADLPFIDAARSARKILVTTEFTRLDALQYAGVTEAAVSKVPMLAPLFFNGLKKQESAGYFLWTTNLSLHKNHKNALKALKIYYEELGGKLSCHVTGVNTDVLLKSPLDHLKGLASLVKGSEKLRSKFRVLGELSEVDYTGALSKSAFLWHAGTIDNGTFSVIEAACLGVPSLSSDYPPMREIDEQFRINLTWMDSGSPRKMAQQLKYMEERHSVIRSSLPTSADFSEQSVAKLAGKYWGVVRECL